MFSYPSISPVAGLSGVISPTFNLLASPGATPRTTPRSTPVPRWCTPFILEDTVDCAVMINNINSLLVSGFTVDDMLLQESTSSLGRTLVCCYSMFRE